VGSGDVGVAPGCPEVIHVASIESRGRGDFGETGRGRRAG
jgi:hypothetical protein